MWLNPLYNDFAAGDSIVLLNGKQKTIARISQDGHKVTFEDNTTIDLYTTEISELIRIPKIIPKQNDLGAAPSNSPNKGQPSMPSRLESTTYDRKSTFPIPDLDYDEFFGKFISGPSRYEHHDFGPISEKYRPCFEDEIKKRGIQYLIHFTHKSNLDSIKRNGLLSKEDLERSGARYRFTDDGRYDGRRDGICVSVSKPNVAMLTEKIRSGAIKDPIIIRLDPRLLLDPSLRFMFFDGNAASNDSEGGSLFRDFRRMFTKPSIEIDGKILTREDLNRKPNEPTDYQAEIMVQGRIPSKYIIDWYDYRE